MSVLVVCDSTAALEPAWVETYGVQVVPLTVTVGSSTGPVAYADGDLSDAELERRAASGPVTTAAPAPGRWLDAVERYAGADGAVLIAVAERLSSSAQSARLAAHLGSRPDRPVQVVDSGSAAGGEALVVLAAARAAARGRDLAAVAAAASRAARGVHLVGTLGSLDRLAAGGRVPGLTLRAGRALDVHPLFRLRAGRVRPMVPAFSRAAAMDRITQACRASRPAGAQGTGAAVVSHALAEDDAQRLADRVRADGVPCEVGRFGSALLAHAGPGTVGLSWWWDTLEG